MSDVSGLPRVARDAVGHYLVGDFVDGATADAAVERERLRADEAERLAENRKVMLAAQHQRAEAAEAKLAVAGVDGTILLDQRAQIEPLIERMLTEPYELAREYIDLIARAETAEAELVEKRAERDRLWDALNVSEMNKAIRVASSVAARGGKLSADDAALTRESKEGDATAGNQPGDEDLKRDEPDVTR